EASVGTAGDDGLPAAGPLRTRSEGAGHLFAGRPDGRPRRRPSRVRPTRVPRRGVAEDTSHHDGGMMDFQNLDAYWRAANYLTVGQIYLQDNPLLREPLRAEHIKPRLLGHWGTSPGLSFIYLHLNRLIRETDADVIYLAGPGHGGPAILANVYLEGTYSEIYPSVTQDAEGLRRLFRQFSTPRGRACSEGTVTSRVSSKATSRWTCTRASRRRSRHATPRPARFSRRRGATAVPRGGRAGRRSCSARRRAGRARRSWTANRSR